MSNANITDSIFVLRKEAYEAAYNALRNLDEFKERWKDAEPAGLIDALEQLGYEVFDNFAGIYALSRNGYINQEVGFQEAFFGALAPFVEDNSYISWIREGTYYEYRWLFKGGKMAFQEVVSKVWA